VAAELHALIDELPAITNTDRERAGAACLARPRGRGLTRRVRVPRRSGLDPTIATLAVMMMVERFQY
jgi:hypothetical protein